jgi:hypothetical protein
MAGKHANREGTSNSTPTERDTRLGPGCETFRFSGQTQTSRTGEHS